MHHTHRIVMSLLVAAWILGAAPVPAEESTGETEGPVTAAAVTSSEVLKHLEAWRNETARTQLEAVAKNARDDAWTTAWNVLQAQERSLDAAKQGLRAQAKANPKDPAPPFFLGEILSWEKEREAAQAEWTKARDRAREAVKANGKDAGALYVFGLAQLRLDKMGDAINKFKRAKSNGFNPVLCDYQIGVAQSFQQNWTAAIETFDAVLEADDTFAHAYYYRGRAHKKNDRTDLMVKDLKRFLTLAPDAREATAAVALIQGAGG
jgi:tetratricopeptide (TPR) repeat protein